MISERLGTNWGSALLGPQISTSLGENTFFINSRLDAPESCQLNMSKAFFEAPMRRMLCVEPPPEALEEKETNEEYVGLLKRSLYGTRDAAANFQKEIKKLRTAAENVTLGLGL